MNASEAFKRPRLIRWLRRRTRSTGLARLDDRLREALESDLDVVAGLRGRVEDRALVRTKEVRRVLRGPLASGVEVRLVAERVHGDRADGVPDAVDPLREISEGGGARRVEHREDALGPVEVRLLEELKEGAFAHDVQDHHVDLDRAALHRPEGHGLLRDDGPEGPNVRFVEGPGHEAMDEARLPDALFADEADLEFERLRLGFHRRLSQHNTRDSQERGYQASGPIFRIRNRLARNPRCP